MGQPSTSYRIDEIDRRIIYALMTDARHTSAPMIAKEVNVSPGTIRNRIDQLESRGIIQGYHVTIDFERADSLIPAIFICTVPTAELAEYASAVQQIEGVTHVRELLGGPQNLHVEAIAESTSEFQQISTALSNCGVTIEEKRLLQNETTIPYGPYGPADGVASIDTTNFIRLAGGANVVEVTVTEDAPIVDLSLAEAADACIIDENALVVALERDGRILTPRGETVIQQDDIVTLVYGGDPDDVLDGFQRELNVERPH